MSGQVFLPWRKALVWIFLSTLLISGSICAALLYWHYHKLNRALDPRYTIVAIVQSCDSKEPLQTDFLAELLGLSVDQPINLYRFNTKDAVKKLLACPVIKSAEVKKIFPGMIFVNYALRKPAAYIGDYSNAAIDEEGRLIPAIPFCTPKNIPELYLGLPAGLAWGNNIFNEKTVLAKKILNTFLQMDFQHPCRLRKIDVSKAFNQRYGEREIVLFFEMCAAMDESKRLFLQLAIVRFSLDNWQTQMQKIPELNQRIVRGMYEPFSKIKNRYVIDMRISQLAFIGEER